MGSGAEMALEEVAVWGMVGESGEEVMARDHQISYAASGVLTYTCMIILMVT